MDVRKLNKHLGQAEVDDDKDQYKPPEHLHTIRPQHTIPSERKKTPVMEEVSTSVLAMVAQIREMDACLQRLKEHKKEMQNSLMSQFIAMNERVGRDTSNLWKDYCPSFLCLWLLQAAD